MKHVFRNSRLGSVSIIGGDLSRIRTGVAGTDAGNAFYKALHYVTAVPYTFTKVH